ncbi:hypothetical protein TDSAC_0845 [Thermodesulfobium acidiphilum]|uniref:Uncharacterized protein n=1 Tax=Thermodesulfobium acidiphilum TaxID=1794699 RepID=A0A2R4W0C3_THEAF|nr:hypothetical protein [Thermodesulfobium acidiphilum]AWB10202.1 hypothetical protein TDSAC_0845 [Thermodesulfobium acidiphilum]PMP86471.1 MAG: hypothetical protein C0174_01515 [Thermodesulfobium narugense]
MNNLPINRKLRESVKELISISKKFELAKTFSFEKYDINKILKREQNLPKNLLCFSTKIIKHVFKYNFQVVNEKDSYLIGFLSEAGRDKLNFANKLLIKCSENLKLQKDLSLSRFEKNYFSFDEEFRLLAYLLIIYKIGLKVELFNFCKNFPIKLNEFKNYEKINILEQIKKINVNTDKSIKMPFIKDLIF